jgi:hypothetical protein
VSSRSAPGHRIQATASLGSTVATTRAVLPGTMSLRAKLHRRNLLKKTKRDIGMHRPGWLRSRPMFEVPSAKMKHQNHRACLQPYKSGSGLLFLASTVSSDGLRHHHHGLRHHHHHGLRHRREIRPELRRCVLRRHYGPDSLRGPARPGLHWPEND